MLAALDVRLYPQEDAELPHPSGHLLHAALLNLVRQHDASFAEDLHADSQVKPFSVSTLWPRTRALGDRMTIPKYTECRFRLGTVGKIVFDALATPVFELLALNSCIKLGRYQFVVTEAVPEPPYGGAATFSDILSVPVREIYLRFISPTTFRRKGINVPLPDPQLVYGNLWQRWTAFSDTPIEQAVFDEMLSACAVTEAILKTRIWKYPRFMLNGFTGRVKFELVKPVSDEAECLFGGLSRLAFFTGVGYRTTMGMGQCVLDSPDYENAS